MGRGGGAEDKGMSVWERVTRGGLKTCDKGRRGGGGDARSKRQGRDIGDAGT